MREILAQRFCHEDSQASKREGHMRTTDPVLKAKALYAERRQRASYLPANVFGEPGWDMLLHLYVAKSDGGTVTVRAACFAADVPEAAALQALDHLQALGMTRRIQTSGEEIENGVELEESAFNQLTKLLEGLR
jgi:MarR family transcriptional regulator, temperature-dependent positive regulator of motility